jgi:hypothetical protein
MSVYLNTRKPTRTKSVALTTQHSISARVGTTSPTSGGRSVGIVRFRTKATEFCCCLLFEIVRISEGSNTRQNLEDCLLQLNGLGSLASSNSELIYYNESFTRLIGFLGRATGHREGATYTRQHKLGKNPDIHPCLEWNSNPRSQCSSRRRNAS